MQRPIIMGVRGEAQRIVDEAGAGINITPDSGEELADAVERLADDPQLSERLGRQARDYVAEHFDRDRLAERFLDLLHEVLGWETLAPESTQATVQSEEGCETPPREIAPTSRG